MTLEDIARLKLEIDAAAGKESLDDLKRLGKEINAELRDMEAAGEKGSDAWRELKNQQREVNQEIKELARNIDINNASMNELTAASRQLHRDLNQLTVGTEEWLDKLERIREVDDKIADVKKQIRGIREEAEEQDGFWTKFKANFAAAFTWDAIKEAGEAIFDFGKEVLEVTSKFEKYNAILSTTLGSNQAASAAFQMIQKFAAETNFSVEELTESYVKMANRGLRPGQDEMKKLADVANATGKPFEQLVEAINDVNNTERWGEIGIKAQTSGDKVTFSYRGVTQTVERTEQGVMKAMVAFGEMNGVAGTTEKISKTLEGQVSNLGDSYQQLQAAIGNELKGAFSTLISILGQAITAFGEIWKGTTSVRDVFSVLWNSIGTLASSFVSLIKTYWDLDDKMKGTEVVSLIINRAFQAIGTAIQVLVTFITVGVDALNIMLNKGKEVANFFGASFKINPTATFDTLKKNFSDNTQAIKKIWDDTETGRDDKSKSVNDSILKNLTTSQNQATKVASDEAKKQAEARQKAEEEAQKKIDDMRVAAIKDETQRQIAAENLRYQREVEAITKSLASDKQKKDMLSLAEAAHQDKVTQINTQAEEKRTKEATENAQKLATLRAKLTGDELQVKLLALEKQKAEDEAYIQKTVKDETEKTSLLQQLNEKLFADKLKVALTTLEKQKAEDEAFIKKTVTDETEKHNKLKALTEDYYTKRMALLNKQEAEETAFIQQTITEETDKTTRLKALHDKYTAERLKVSLDALEKQKAEDEAFIQKTVKDETEKTAKLKDLADRYYAAKLALLEKQKADDEAYIRQHVSDETQMAADLKALNDKFVADVDAVKKRQQEEEARRNKAHRDQQLREEKELFDATYQAEVEKANLSLALTKDNAQQQYQAKLNLLELEAKYKTQKLQREASEEKARIAESIQDTDVRKQTIEAIDERLSAQLRLNETQLQADKKRLQEEANQQRQANNKQFFDALNGLMKGDYTAFIDLLNKKLANSSAANQKELQEFTQKGQDTLQIATQVVGSLQLVNQKYLDTQLAKIKKEKDEQVKSWDAQYKAGVISKEEYDDKVDELNKEAAEKEKAEKLKAWKRDQALQIAMALINAAAAALKSLATMGFPLGLIGVAGAAALAAVQIGMIKSQKPPDYKYGGYVRNAGVPEGPLHGRNYGDSGIAMTRRDTGEEIGELEGGEPIMILSRNTYRNNRGVIDRLLHSSLHQNGAKIFRNGGLTGSDGGSYDNYLAPTQFGQMYLFGSKKRREALEAQAQAKVAQMEAEKEAQRSMDEAQASMAAYGDGGGYDGEYGTATGGSMDATVAMTDEQIQLSQEMMSAIADNTEATVQALETTNSSLDSIYSALDTANTFLSAIAAKDLSISVQNIINVNNQIDVVVDASNFK